MTAMVAGYLLTLQPPRQKPRNEVSFCFIVTIWPCFTVIWLILLVLSFAGLHRFVIGVVGTSLVVLFAAIAHISLSRRGQLDILLNAVFTILGSYGYLEAKFL